MIKIILMGLLTGSLMLRADIGTAYSRWCSEKCEKMGALGTSVQKDCYYRCHKCKKNHKGDNEDLRISFYKIKDVTEKKYKEGYKIQNSNGFRKYTKQKSNDCYNSKYCLVCVGKNIKVGPYLEDSANSTLIRVKQNLLVDSSEDSDT